MMSLSSSRTSSGKHTVDTGVLSGLTLRPRCGPVFGGYRAARGACLSSFYGATAQVAKHDLTIPGVGSWTKVVLSQTNESGLPIVCEPGV